MSERSSIEWTDATWNPVRGCSRVSEGCRNCYAERIASRFSRLGMTFDGFAFDNFAGNNGRRRGWTGKVELIPSKLDEPLHWRKPRRVFVNSMSDLFHESLPDEAIAEVFLVMALAGAHTFQILTKRPARMLKWMRNENGERMAIIKPRGRGDWKAVDPYAVWPLPNVWLGTSCEDQPTADARIPLLLQTPAAKRFVSYEPALGPVDFRPHLGYDNATMIHLLSWVIVGGESGPGARPFDVAWARSTVRQCREAGVACFVKQMGRWVLGDHEGFAVNHFLLPGGRAYVPALLPSLFRRPAEAIGFSLPDPKGGNPAEWSEDLRVREFPA